MCYITMKELSILLLIMLSIFVYITYLRKTIFLEKVKSNFNGKEYYVRNLPDKQEAANLLSEISDNLKQLITDLDDKDERNQRLKKKFKTENITENIHGSIYVAYSVNKGDELSLCIRDKKTNKFLDKNTIMFVAIHEVAHIMTKETGHTKKFWANMKFLLEKAIEAGYYYPVNYSMTPMNYCGLEIDSTPLDM